jgi:ProP effector
VKKNSRILPEGKPVVITRKKVGTRSSPPGPIQPLPKAPPSVAKRPAPVPPPASAKPRQQVRQPPSPEVTAPGLSKKKQEQQARRELLDLFRKRWPKVFPIDPQQVKPLAIGIKHDIATQLPQQPLIRIGVMIGIFERLMGAAYYQAILRGGPRYDLEGKPRGEVTPEDQERARRDLAAYHERRKQWLAKKRTARESDQPAGMPETS